MRRVLTGIVVAALLFFPSAIGGTLWVRAAQRHDSCVAAQNQYDTTHELIQELGKPGGTGKRLQDVTIPPGTDPQVIDILRQITGPADPGPTDLTRFYAILGTRPRC